MPNPSVSYPLRVYDLPLWQRILDLAKTNGTSINEEIGKALAAYAPVKKNKP